MATTTTSTAPDSSTDAAFRAWGSAFATLLSVGSNAFWTQAADSGQINWASVVHPGTSVIAGYEIWKTNDALSSTFRLYMKVEYGTAAFGTNTPGVWITFGTGTNGAGTLTGNVSSQYRHNPALAGGSSLLTSYASGEAGRFGMMLWGGGNTKLAMCLILERSRDSSGSLTSDYITWILNMSTNADGQNFSQRCIRNPGLGTFSTEAGSTGAFVPYWQPATAAFGTFAAPFPVFPFMGYPDNPMTACMGFKSGDISELGTFDVVLYGVSRHYLWSNQGWFRLGGSTQTNLGIGMRYD